MKTKHVSRQILKRAMYWWMPLFLLGGCDLPLANASCNRPSRGECEELTGATPNDTDFFQRDCPPSVGVWSSNLCSRKNLVGGCQGPLAPGDPSTDTTWYYVDAHEGAITMPWDVSGLCLFENRTFVYPPQ